MSSTSWLKTVVLQGTTAVLLLALPSWQPSMQPWPYADLLCCLAGPGVSDRYVDNVHEIPTHCGLHKDVSTVRMGRSKLQATLAEVAEQITLTTAQQPTS
jgi:hypothetical protein